MAERMKLTFQERLNTVLGESYLKKYSPQEALNKYLEETNLHKYTPQEALKIIADDTTEYTPQEILNALYDQTYLKNYTEQEAMNLLEEFFSNGYYGELDGTGDYFSMESTVTLTGEFSIAFWNKIKTAASHNYTLNDSVGNCFIDNVQLAQLVLRFGGTDKYLSYDSARTLNVWDSIIITRDASNDIKVYLNNVLQSDPDNHAGNFSFNYIGYRPSIYSHNDTDELAIYDYELTTADRALIVGSGTPETCGDAGATSTAPIQFWRFENNGDNEITSNTLTKEADAAYTAY